MGLVTTMMESYCTIYRPAITRDATGGVLQTYNAVNTTPIPCSAQEASGSVQKLYEQQNIFVSTTFYFAQDPQVQANDKIIATSTLTNTTRTYIVKGRSQSDVRGHVWTAPAEWIQEPS